MLGRKEKKIVSVLALIIIVAVTFSPSIKNGFTNWDDPKYVTRCPLIKNLSAGNIFKIFTSYHYRLYKPLVLLSLAIDYHFAGENPFFYHLINLLFHISNTVLLFFVIYTLTGKTSVACLTAILFGIHPMHVESVAWVSERKDMLYSFFLLLSLFFYIHFTRKNSKKSYSFSLGFFVMSLLAKPAAIILPVLLFVFDYLEQRRFRKEVFVEKIPFFIVSGLFTAINFYGHFLGSSSSAGRSQITAFPENFMNAAYAVFFYLKKAILPLGLSCVYPDPGAKSKYYLVVLLILFILFIRSKKVTRKVVFGGAFFFITLLPVLQFFTTGPSIVSDRYTYIPYIGIFYILSEWVYWVRKKYFIAARASINYVFFGMGVLLIVSLSFLTIRRIRVWKDSVTLWSDVISKYPRITIAYAKRGEAYFEKGDNILALNDFNKVLSLDPEFALAYVNRGIVYSKGGEFDRGIADITRAIQLDPGYELAYINRGLAFYNKHDFLSAIDDFNKAIEVNPGSAGGYYNRAVVYDSLNNPQKAISDFSKAIEFDPYHYEAYFNRGFLYDKKGMLGKAISDYSRALELTPRSENARINRGVGYAAKGDIRRAIEDFNEVLRLYPESIDANFNRAIAYCQKGFFREALNDLDKVIEADPGHVKGRKIRAEVNYRLGRYEVIWEDVRIIKALGGKIENELLEKFERTKK